MISFKTYMSHRKYKYMFTKLEPYKSFLFVVQFSLLQVKYILRSPFDLLGTSPKLAGTSVNPATVQWQCG